VDAVDPQESAPAPSVGRSRSSGEAIPLADRVPAAASTASAGQAPANEASSSSLTDMDRAPIAAGLDTLEDERRINLASADDGAAIIASNKEVRRSHGFVPVSRGAR
jgi:hypothetical protein